MGGVWDVWLVSADPVMFGREGGREGAREGGREGKGRRGGRSCI